MEENIFDGETDLLHRLAQKEEAAFIYIYKRFYRSIVLYAEKITEGELDIAYDATADAFIDLWKRDIHFSQVGQLISYLRKVVHHKCIDRFREQKRQSAIENQLLYLSEKQQDELFYDEIFLEAELLRKIREEVEKLPFHSKEVFKLAFFHSLSNSEIAGQLGIKNSSVRRRKTEALNHLRKVLKGLEWDMLIWIILSLKYLD